LLQTDAEQGKSEKRSEPYSKVRLVSIATFNAVMRYLKQAT
jgi:hypothetical protein